MSQYHIGQIVTTEMLVENFDPARAASFFATEFECEFCNDAGVVLEGPTDGTYLAVACELCNREGGEEPSPGPAITATSDVSRKGDGEMQFTRSSNGTKRVVSDLAESLRFEEPVGAVRSQARPLPLRGRVSRTSIVQSAVEEPTWTNFDAEMDALTWAEGFSLEDARLFLGDTERDVLREEVGRRDARERAEALFCRRAEVDAWVESKRRESDDQHRVSGDYWGAGPAAEKAWLDARIAQLRIECRELILDGRRKGYRVDPLSDAQVQAIRRQAVSLRHRHNFKRFVEALACDPELQGSDFQEAFDKAQAWRRREGLTYRQAVAKLERVHRLRWIKGDESWVGVEGLIAA